MTIENAIFKEWQLTLIPSNKTLQTLSGATEEDFLQIGSKLQEFYARSTGLSELANQLVDMVSGVQVQDLIVRLRQMIADMEAYISHASSQSCESCTTLEMVLKHLDTISEPLEGFQKMTKALRMLGISTKIESARMGDAGLGFVTLAKDVQKLSDQVNDKSSNILKHRQELSASISQNLRAVRDSEKNQETTLDNVLAGISSSLEELISINERCCRFGSLVSSVSSDVSKNISEIVSSMQMHDMTRQQVEHIVEALEKLLKKMDDYSSSDAESIKNLVVEVGDVCELQEAQLRFASSELCGAVTIVVDNLRDVAGQQEQLAAETLSATGNNNSDNGSFMETLSRGMNTVTIVLVQCAAADQKMSEILIHVANTLQEVTGFVTDIEEIGTEIDLIALNSQVKAALTGTEGAALGVLAEAVKRLSLDAISQTNAVSGTLKEINSATEHLFKEANQETEELKNSVGIMDVELKDILNQLGKMNSEMNGLLANLSLRVCSLTADIDKTTSAIDVHKRISLMADEVTEKLATIVNSARQIEPASNEFKNNLKFMEERYTMESERHIHEAIARKRSGIDVTTIKTKEGSSNSDSEFGDNVDLF